MEIKIFGVVKEVHNDLYYLFTTFSIPHIPSQIPVFILLVCLFVFQLCPVIVLLHCCCCIVGLLRCCVVALLRYCVNALLHCCCIVVVALLHCCCIVVVALLRCCIYFQILVGSLNEKIHC